MPDNFSGSKQHDLDACIMQVTRYIKLQNVPDHMQVDVAATCLAGSTAKAWHAAEHMLKQQNQDVNSLQVSSTTCNKIVGCYFKNREADSSSGISKSKSLLSNTLETSKLRFGS